MEERLNAISINKPETLKEPPKADTLVRLLTQGLQSDDKNILKVGYTCICQCLYMMHTMDPTEQWREGLLTPYNPWPDMLIIYSDTAQFYSVSKHVHILVW